MYYVDYFRGKYKVLVDYYVTLTIFFAQKKDPVLARASRSGREARDFARPTFQRLPVDTSEKLGSTHVRVPEPRFGVALQERASETQKRNRRRA